MTRLNSNLAEVAAKSIFRVTGLVKALSPGMTFTSRKMCV